MLLVVWKSISEIGNNIISHLNLALSMIVFVLKLLILFSKLQGWEKREVGLNSRKFVFDKITNEITNNQVSNYLVF